MGTFVAVPRVKDETIKRVSMSLACGAGTTR
jgi:hypothetical protein